jgi:glycosyltransferase involved in cell wall biosynthesis
MFNCFVSVIGIIGYNKEMLNNYLCNVSRVLKDKFSDFEIILVNNCSLLDIREATRYLDQEILKDITVVNLSTKIDLSNAIVAGLDRANGDYTVIFDLEFHEHPELIIDMYKKSQEKYDIVYLKYRKRKIPVHKRIFYNTFYYIMAKYSNLQIDRYMHPNRIISRRALNSILHARERLRYLKGIFSMVGYKTSFIEADIPAPEQPEKFSEQLRSGLIAITSYTDFLNKVIGWGFFLSSLFLFGVTLNALIVKYFGFDVFGHPQQQVPGGTYIVIILSVMFTFASFILYLLCFYVISIYQEIKERPIYIVESIERP